MKVEPIIEDWLTLEMRAMMLYRLRDRLRKHDMVIDAALLRIQAEKAIELVRAEQERMIKDYLILHDARLYEFD